MEQFNFDFCYTEVQEIDLFDHLTVYKQIIDVVFYFLC